MRLFSTAFTLFLLSASGWWLYDHRHELHSTIGQYVENGEFLTLQPAYTPEQIMAAHRNELLPDSRYTFLEPRQLFLPHVLMEVKFVAGDKTKEGLLLWSQLNGELILNTSSWESTHGMEDALLAGANADDFRIIYALLRKGGGLPIQKLQQELNVDEALCSRLVANCRAKQLVTLRDSEVALHIHQPRFAALPITKVAQWIVRRPYRSAELLSARYARKQLLELARTAFGEELAIKQLYDLYIPVYAIDVSTPENTRHTSLWNSLNGTAIPITPTLISKGI